MTRRGATSKRRLQPHELPSPGAALASLCRASRLPEPELEFRFHPTRKWLLDCAWPAFKVGVEFQGGVFGGHGRFAHAAPTHIHRDMMKSRAAQLMGWMVLAYLPRELKTHCLPDLLQLLPRMQVQPRFSWGAPCVPDNPRKEE